MVVLDELIVYVHLCIQSTAVYLGKEPSMIANSTKLQQLNAWQLCFCDVHFALNFLSFS